MLSKKLGTTLQVGDVHFVSFNCVDLKDIVLLDQQKDSLLRAQKVTAQLNISDLLQKKLVIRHLDLFNTSCHLYRESPHSAFNFQFIVDSLSSSDQKESSGLQLMIHTLMIRNLCVNYDCLSEVRRRDHLDFNHLSFRQVDADLRINHVAKDSVNIRLRNIKLKEQCGLELRRLACNVVAGPSSAVLKNFELLLPNSRIALSRLTARHATPQPKLDVVHGDFSDVNLTAELVPKDFSFLLPSLRTLDEPYSLSARLDKQHAALSAAVSLASRTNDNVRLKASAELNLYQLLEKELNLSCQLHQLELASAELGEWLTALSPSKPLPPVLERVDRLRQTGHLQCRGDELTFQGETSCEQASVHENIRLLKNRIHALVEVKQLQLGQLLDSPDLLGDVAGQVRVEGTLTHPTALDFHSTLHDMQFKGYHYKGIEMGGHFSPEELTATVDVNDPHLAVSLQGRYRPRSPQEVLNLTARLQQMQPGKLNLADDYGEASLSAQFSASVQAFSPTLLGRIAVRDLSINDAGKTYGFDSLLLSTRLRNGLFTTRIESDILEGETSGNVALADIPAELFQMVKGELDVLPSIFSDKNPGNDRYAFVDFKLKKADFLEHVLRLPVHFESMPHVTGYFNQAEQKVQLSAYLPLFYLNESCYKEGSVFLTNANDSLRLLAHITKQFDKEDVEFMLNTKARQNDVLSQLQWKTLHGNGTHGSVVARSTFSKDDEGNDQAFVRLYPSNIYVHDSVWQVSPSYFELKKGQYQIRDFKISHAGQFVSLNTRTDGLTSGKGLIAQIKDIDLGYVFDILNFHPVDFEGRASGEILTDDLAESKDVHARLTVRDFTFNTGSMGVLQLKGKWYNDNKTILLDAKTQESDEDSTLIRGFVNVGENRIDLQFESMKTNLGFLNKYLGGIFSGLEGRTTGQLRLSGPLNAMNLEGREKLDYLTLSPRVLNTTYHITNDSVILSPGKIHFKNITLKDQHGNVGHINGDILHRVLHDFRFDVAIDADNLLVYDWNDRETDTFWGTVYGDGLCKLSGSTDELHVNLSMTPRSNSTFVYDSSTPGDNDNNEYIHFVNPFENKATDLTDRGEKVSDNSLKDSSTDIYLDFNINATPEATLVILTDNKTGDKMSLNGHGPLHINYYNKGRFNIFVTYNLDHGQYRITIRDIIHKNFAMQQGGTIRFNGAPMDGDLNLKGIYTINSVSLADLNLGNLKSNSANVDCILYFKGKCGSPQISFDLDLPNVNEDENQMVRNMIASQGDMNMQIIYLLGIGRFFTYDYANFNGGTTLNNQSSVAMQSLLASTLSEQFNSMLSNALHLNNWKFGTSIATGRMGWSDMEVEGLLSGSLLNNRVLINGNFGYRDQPTYSNNFVGDFNVRWLLTPSGGISLKAYSETNDRYFTKTSLTTNGIGILFQRDFNSLRDFFHVGKKK